MRSSLRMSTAPLSLEASPPAGRSSPAGLLGLGFLDVSPQEQQPAPAAPGALFARPSSDGAELGAAMPMQPQHAQPLPFHAPAEQPGVGVMLNPALESPIPVGQPLAPSPLAPSPLSARAAPPPEQVPPAAALVVTVNPAAALAVTVNPAAQAIPVVQPCAGAAHPSGHGRAGVAEAWAVGASAAPAAPTVAVARAAKKGQGGRVEQKRAEQKRAEQKRLPDPEVVQQVRAYMKEHELSQRTFSESCQISQTVICHWLAAKYKGDNAKVRNARSWSHAGERAHRLTTDCAGVG